MPSSRILIPVVLLAAAPVAVIAQQRHDSRAPIDFSASHIELQDKANRAILSGGATLKLDGMYFSDPQRRHLLAEDTVSGTVRPWGLGPRVPMTVISPWSKGGWVNSQVFDHTSVIRFLEKRFGVHEPNISAWRRVVCGDLTSLFNFATPNNERFPDLPAFSKAEADNLSKLQDQLDAVPVPTGSNSIAPRQRMGARPSRALPYELHVQSNVDVAASNVQLQFINTGSVGAVFHVYDQLHLDRIPRRYTVEAGKSLTGGWNTLLDQGRYDLWVLGPNGFHRQFKGNLSVLSMFFAPLPEVRVSYSPASSEIQAT